MFIFVFGIQLFGLPYLNESIIYLTYLSMKNIFSLFVVLIIATTFSAQIQTNETPFHWFNKSIETSEIEFVRMPLLDMESIRAEDDVVDQYKETPYRFGIENEVDIDFFEDGTATVLKNGDKIWRLGIYCPEATSINFVFGEFMLPEGGEVHVWNENREEFIGALTHLNNKEYGSLGVGIIHSERIVIDYYEPASVAGQAILNISQIIHGYRPIVNKTELEKGPFGTSGSCNMNVNCADGNPWQQEKRGVALIILGGSVCTGSLINNTTNDGTPYFLTAAHCAGNESNWVFYFNHEYSGCSNTGTVPINQTVSGSVIQASTIPSDAHLVLISSSIPAAYNPYFNGWDNSGTIPSLGIGIHHPAGDVKKLAFDDDPLTKSQYGGAAMDHWRIEAWERSTTTEGGSSGSPLFDQNHRIVGQLHGGAANCSNSINDYYGAFNDSWSTLSPYLDSGDLGNVILNGYGPNDFATDAQSNGVQNIPESTCDLVPFVPTFSFSNLGTTTITSATITPIYNLLLQPEIIWNGTLAPGESVDVILPEIITEFGENLIVVSVEIIGDENSSNNVSNNTFSGTSAQAIGYDEINIFIQPDNYGSETTWELIDPNGVTVESGGPYVNGVTTPIIVNYEINIGDGGCYEFNIYDSYQDGICCEYGIGYYSVTDAEGTEMLLGSEFGAQGGGGVDMRTGAVALDIQVFLEGPYNSNDDFMTDNLRVSDIPFEEPYTAFGYTHAGGGGAETSSYSIFSVLGFAAVVDWVFLELRDGNDPTIVLATKSVLLRRSGRLMEMDGAYPITFDFIDASSVYVAIRHRNHLGIRSANSYSTNGQINIDFRDLSTPIYGNNPTKIIGDIQAMIAADANNDGQVGPVDKNDYWRVENGNPYDYMGTKADFNLDGVVNAVDKNAFWRINNSMIEQLD